MYFNQVIIMTICIRGELFLISLRVLTEVYRME